MDMKDERAERAKRKDQAAGLNTLWKVTVAHGCPGVFSKLTVARGCPGVFSI